MGRREPSEAQAGAGGLFGDAAPVPDVSRVMVSNAVVARAADELYRLYPRHVGPRVAKAAIERAIRRVQQNGVVDPIQWLKDRVNAYAEAARTMDRQYIPHPSTWFNQDRFDDDPEEWGVSSVAKSEDDQIRRQIKEMDW
jgi:hypothetical protein